MLYVSLKSDLTLNLCGEIILLKAEDVVKVDTVKSIAFHEASGKSFDIDPTEYDVIN